MRKLFFTPHYPYYAPKSTTADTSAPRTSSQTTHLITDHDAPFHALQNLTLLHEAPPPHSTPTSTHPHPTPKPLNTFTIGIGSNKGQSFRIFNQLFLWLARHRSFTILSTSPIYQNPAFGYTKQSDFYNATLTLQTPLSLREVFGVIFYLERKFARPRIREFKNAPRTLDIDLIFFNHLKLNYPHLKLPHPYWKQRESVIIPLVLQKMREEK